MSEQDEVLMAKYGVTSETHTIYRYKEHRYENLKDALNFAKLDSDSQTGSPTPKND